MLDPTYGTYPNVTSSMCTSAGILDSIGLNICDLSYIMPNTEVIGVVKSYPTRVGSGVLPTMMNDDEELISNNIILYNVLTN